MTFSDCKIARRSAVANADPGGGTLPLASSPAIVAATSDSTE